MISLSGYIRLLGSFFFTEDDVSICSMRNKYYINIIFNIDIKENLIVKIIFWGYMDYKAYNEVQIF